MDLARTVVPVKTRRLGCAAWMLVGLVGCDADVLTELGQVQLPSEDLDALFVSGRGIVEQSRVCFGALEPGPALGGLGGHPDDGPGAELGDCYAWRLEGSAAFDDGGCVAFGSPGEAALHFDRRPCAIEGDLDDDLVHFDVLPLDAVRGAFDPAVPADTELIERFDLVVQDASTVSAWIGEVGAPVYFIEDRFTSVRALAVRDDRPELVAVTQPRVSATVVAGAPVFEIGDEPSIGLSVDAAAGDVFDVSMTLAAGTLAVGQVHVVARSEAVALELSPLIMRPADTDEFFALGAVAVARDREGRVLHEPPVHWTVVEGDVELDAYDGDDDGEPDPSQFAFLLDAGCERVAAGTWRSARLAGEMDSLRETIRVRWQCVEGGHDDGCGCSAQRGRGWLGSVGMLVLVLLRRRERR